MALPLCHYIADYQCFPWHAGANAHHAYHWWCHTGRQSGDTALSAWRNPHCRCRALHIPIHEGIHLWQGGLLHRVRHAQKPVWPHPVSEQQFFRQDKYRGAHGTCQGRYWQGVGYFVLCQYVNYWGHLPHMHCSFLYVPAPCTACRHTDNCHVHLRIHCRQHGTPSRLHLRRHQRGECGAQYRGRGKSCRRADRKGICKGEVWD